MVLEKCKKNHFSSFESSRGSKLEKWLILHFSSTKKTHRRRPRIKKRLKQAYGLVHRVLITRIPNLKSDFNSSKAFSRYDLIHFNERVSRKPVGIFEIGFHIRISREKNSPSITLRVIRKSGLRFVAPFYDFLSDKDLRNRRDVRTS